MGKCDNDLRPPNQVRVRCVSELFSWQAIDLLTSCGFFETLGLVKGHRPVVFDGNMCHPRIGGVVD